MEKRTEKINEDYEVHDNGMILSVRSNQYLKPSSVTKKSRYATVEMHGKTYAVHKLVANAFLPFDPDMPEVNHIDGDRTNNALSNLERCTSKYNTAHAFKSGLRKAKQGSSHPRARLTETDVLIIKEANAKFGYGSLSHLARYFKQQPTNICAILKGRKWKHV